MEFTKEQLITHITRHSDEINRLIKQQSHHDNEYRKKLLAVNEIALASLAAEPVAINDNMAYAFHHALSDSSLGADDVEDIKTGLRAAFANVTAPVIPDELIPLIESLKPEHGAPGSRDVEVTAKRDAVDSIIKLLRPGR